MTRIAVDTIISEDKERVMFGGRRLDDGSRVSFAVNGEGALTMAAKVREAEAGGPAVEVDLPMGAA